jgi:small subunit ribosomal protein S6
LPARVKGIRCTSKAVRPKEAQLKRPYETVVIFDATLPDDTIKSESGKLEEFLKKNAEFEKTEVMGKKYLAYPISKKKTGVYYLYLYKGEGDVAGKLEKYLKLNEAVVRHLSVVRSENNRKPAQEVPVQVPRPIEEERA